MVTVQIRTTGIMLALLVIATMGGAVLMQQGLQTDRPTAATARSDKSDALLPVQTSTLAKTSHVSLRRELTGTIRAGRRVLVTFERTAYLERVLADEGDLVSEGRLLAEIDTERLRQSLDELNSSLAQQTAVLSELKAGARREVIDAARAEVRALSAQAELARTTLRRMQQLRLRDAASQQQLDEAQLSFEAVAARQQAAQKRLDELLAGTRPEQIAAQEALINVIRAQLAQRQTDLKNSQLSAPFDATVVRRLADEGQLVGPGQPVFDLIETSRLEAHVGVPERLLNTIRRQDRFTLRTDSGALTAKLKSIVPLIDRASRTQNVIFTIESPAAGMAADGQLVRLTIEENEPLEGFRIPLTALSAGSRGLWTVYVFEPEPGSSDIGRVSARSVQVVHSDEHSVVIQGLVSDGEQIVSTGVHRIIDGQLVRHEPSNKPPSDAQPPSSADHTARAHRAHQAERPHTTVPPTSGGGE